MRWKSIPFFNIFLSYTGLFGIFNIIPNLLLKDNKINRIKKESLLFNIISAEKMLLSLEYGNKNHPYF